MSYTKEEIQNVEHEEGKSRRQELEPAIEMVEVEKSFGRQKVLDGVSLSIPEGTTTLITGASGTGKSVMLKLMLGLLKADEGKVLVFGEDLARVKKKDLNRIRKDFGVLFQNAALFDSMTVFDNVALPLRERTSAESKEIRSNVEEKLAMMDLEGAEKKYPAQLSGGMRKRVGLARALVLEPKIVFFDEPTTGLDVAKSNEIYRLFYRTQKKFRYTAVIVSHDVPKIFKLADAVALIDNGTLHGPMSPEDFQLSGRPIIHEFVEKTMGPIYTSEKEEIGFYEKMER